MNSHIIIYSHGFGVRKDDRGLFTDIAAGLNGVESILFDYNRVDEAANTLTVAPLEVQAKKLLAVTADAKTKNPDAVIDLVCHSQGCIVAALARPTGIRKTILAAPPADILDTEKKIKKYCAKFNITFTKDGTVRLPRKDGSITIIPPEFWQACDGFDTQGMYSQLAEHTKLTIIAATEDEVLGEVAFDRLSPRVKVVEMATGHNFEGDDRAKIIQLVASELGIGLFTNDRTNI